MKSFETEPGRNSVRSATTGILFSRSWKPYPLANSNAPSLTTAMVAAGMSRDRMCAAIRPSMKVSSSTGSLGPAVARIAGAPSAASSLWAAEEPVMNRSRADVAASSTRAMDVLMDPSFDESTMSEPPGSAPGLLGYQPPLPPHSVMTVPMRRAAFLQLVWIARCAAAASPLRMASTISPCSATETSSSLVSATTYSLP